MKTSRAATGRQSHAFEQLGSRLPGVLTPDSVSIEMRSHLPSPPASPWRGTHSKGRRLPTGRDKQWNISGVKPEIAPPLLDKAEDRASKWVKMLELGHS
jgi:hypothetical protein